MKYTLKKYDGDDSYSWAVFRKIDLPKGHRGPVFYGEAEPLVSGCCRTQAETYKRNMEAGGRS